MLHFRNSETGLLFSVPVLKTCPGKASYCPFPRQPQKGPDGWLEGQLPVQRGGGALLSTLELLLRGLYTKRRWYESKNRVPPLNQRLLSSLPGFLNWFFFSSSVRLQEQKEISQLPDTFPHLEQNCVCMILISEWVLLVILFVWSKFQLLMPKLVTGISFLVLTTGFCF